MLLQSDKTDLPSDIWFGIIQQLATLFCGNELANYCTRVGVLFSRDTIELYFTQVDDLHSLCLYYGACKMISTDMSSIHNNAFLHW